MNDSIFQPKLVAYAAALTVLCTLVVTSESARAGSAANDAVARGTAVVAVATPPSYSTAAQATASAAQVRIGASTALQPLAAAAAKKYGMQAAGLSVAVTPLAEGGAFGLAGTSIDVAFTDTVLSGTAIVDRKIAVLPLAFVANHADGISSLTGAQIRDLLTGKISNWNQVGGGDVPVYVIGRGSFAGITPLLGRRYLGGQAMTAPASVAETTAAAIAAVTKIKGAISIVTFDAARVANANLTTLAVDGATADEAHVGDGSYPLWTYEHAGTQGKPTPSVVKFLSLLENDRELLHAQGFIAVSDLGPGALKLEP